MSLSSSLKRKMEASAAQKQRQVIHLEGKDVVVVVVVIDIVISNQKKFLFSPPTLGPSPCPFAR